MARNYCEKRVLEYSKEFKVNVVKLTDGLNVKVIEIADILGLHPMMVYRWRQEYREGKLTYEPSRRIRMTKKKLNPRVSQQQEAEVKRLQKENAYLQKENDFLKKWQRYLAEQNKSDSVS